MRYSEIIEATRARQASKAAAKRKSAREQMAAAERERANSVRKYHDDLEASRLAVQRAKATLQATSMPEAMLDPDRRDLVHGLSLIEGRRAYSLRDRTGSILGWIESVGRLLQAKDRHGSVVGWYDPRTDQTRDSIGSIVGNGDLLAALIMCRRP
jgi:hypothetical protein